MLLEARYLIFLAVHLHQNSSGATHSTSKFCVFFYEYTTTVIFLAETVFANTKIQGPVTATDE